ncbi:MAG: phospholipid carrier-dependent glycosyltransferase, partial [Candidatus Omnitrophica bacterium]|nr:phospholipid carrier-dependent glycosyltransferase [Candidatus Omnitrophota bacterium]
MAPWVRRRKIRPVSPAVSTWVISLICLGAWGAHLPALFQHQSGITDDGASYIEAARSLQAGRGLTVRPHNGLEPALWQPLTIWPPGYPLLLAVAQAAGLSEPASWAAVSVGSMALAVVLLVWIISRFFTPLVTLAVVLTVVLMPAFLSASLVVMSDPPYLVAATASIACLLAWAQRPRQPWRWLAAAGLLAGLAWGIRYVAVALWTATAAWLLAHFLWMPWRQVLRSGLAWAAGLLLGAGPFILRNILLTGEMTPYHMSPSELSVWDNVRVTVHAILLEITRWQTGIDWLVSHVPTAAILAALSALAVWLWLRPFTISQAKVALERYRPALLLALYLCIHLAVLIAARSKYRWGAMIDIRVMLPVFWIVWMGLAAAILAFARRLRLKPRAGRLIAISLLMVLTGLQIRDHQDHLHFLRTTVSGASRNVMEYAFGERVVEALKQEIGPDQIVLSPRAFLLRVHGDLNARQLLPVAKVEAGEMLTLEAIRQAGQSGLLWGIILD